ncbi:MAG: hypothetical protein DCF19_20045 [Pseudanabaena frigida]|uniref:Uncharacterized protein n=1 Tax=Pseudanabaena frigida TaxID=945775 RepID=A0A2W4Y0K1_9CYAN|nr:MAG: hypothetical protein DCF19_20045 [Pseudanabaena frigida]
MENWEFLLQRKGDKSWLPLESPTVEILEGQYRLAARSDLANVLVGIAIAYRPLADVRHQPLQQKIVKRISHDGLLIVMPYTNFVPGAWQIDCCAAEIDSNNEVPPWKKTVKFDAIQISSDFGSDWQYSDLENDPEGDLENPAEIPSDIHANALGIAQTEPTPLNYSSPILEIAEQRSTELVQSMFDEFSLFNDENDETSDEFEKVDSEKEKELTSDRSTQTHSNLENTAVDAEFEPPLQPRILLRLHQPQYIINENNSFLLTGEAYAHGEIEISLKDPQSLDIVVNQRYKIANLGDRNAATGAIPFNYQVIVPPPSEIQVLIGEVQIHPQQDFQQYGDLFVTQQAIAVSYPASRVLPEMIKEAQKYSSQDISQNSSQTNAESTNSSSYPQTSQSFPQVSRRTEQVSPKPKPANSLSLPPLPSNKPKAAETKSPEQQSSKSSLSLPPLSPLPNQTSNFTSSETLDDSLQSFPQVEVDELQKIELEFSLTDFSDLANIESQSSSAYDDEPELLYSFEEELPQNYEEMLEQPSLKTPQLSSNNFPPLSNTRNDAHNRGSNFLNKLQTLSAEAIAVQKANQRTEELLLDTFPPSDPLTSSETLSGVSVDLNNPDRPTRTIAEETSLAKLDRELDLEFDRLLAPEPDLILNEYVWEETVDPNTFPVSAVTNSNAAASALSETAQTIRNIQDSTPQSLSEQEPIPVPEILVPEGEIISGTPMIVKVRLVAIAPKFFVKFWIKDLQTRTIIDGPRWLLDFSVVPDTEFIETQTNISIPLSSIDVAFEAIAIEAQTQRESHKVRVTRAVAPPNLAQDLNFDL